MPVLDCREATLRIRDALGEQAPAVIAVSASSMSREERAIGELFDGYVRKPVARELLYAALAEHLGTGEEQAGTAGTTPADPDEVVGQSSDRVELDEQARATLRALRTETLPRLQRTLRAGEVRRFAAALTELAEAQGLPDLNYYSERLAAAVERFDVGLMESLLAQGDEHLGSALGDDS